MLALYGVYILIMVHNEPIKECVTRQLLAYPTTANLISSAMSVEGPDDVFGSPGAPGNTQSSGAANGQPDKRSFFAGQQAKNYQTTSMMPTSRTVEEDSMFLAACLVMVRHKRLFRSQLRFQAAARYIIIKRQHKLQQLQQQQKAPVSKSNEVNYFGPESEPLKPSNQRDRMEAYAKNASLSKNKFSIVSKDDYEFWNRPPDEGESKFCCFAIVSVARIL